MKTIRIKIILVFLIMTQTFMSCLNLSELNEDPNNPTKVSSNYILTYVLSKTAVYYKSLGNYNSQVAGAMQYVQEGTNFGAERMNFLDWDRGDWGGYYELLRNVEIINKYSMDDKNPAFEAISLTLRAFLYATITDIFGDAPYSESLKATEQIYFPKYDEQKLIYQGILNDLNKAEEIFAQSTTMSYSVNATSDILFGGDLTKWRKFTNSLRLRYAMRLYNKKTDMQTLGINIVSIFNDAAPKAFTSNDDSAKIEYLGTNSENSHPGGPIASSVPPYTSKPCKTMVDKLKLLKDPRLYRWAMPVLYKWDYNIATQTDKTVTNMFGDSYTVKYLPTTNLSVDTSLYVGLPHGLPILETMAYNKGDNTETFHSARSPFISMSHQRYRENKDPLLKMELMMYSEVEFLLAEAALKGDFSVSGTSEGHYKKGIIASFNRWGITDGQNGFNFDSYYTNSSVNYVQAANKLERIMEQKWLSGWLTAEPWFDWRRTGYPDLKTGPVTSFGPAIPVRMEYPTPNSDEKYMVNYNEAISRLEATVYVPSGQSKDHSYSKTWLLKGTGKPW